MKILTIAVPCYNSASYMEHCIKTLLSGGSDVEIIIVNDGSTKDNTLEIAQKYESENPQIVRVIDKPNGGHGSAVMAGIKNAEGLYFKVVDSDDWVDEDAFAKVIEKLKSFSQEEDQIDMLLSNFVYDKVGAKIKKTMHYGGIIPKNKIIEWKNCKHFPIGKYILMHSIIYRTQVLRDCKIELPEHTFYVDNIFAFSPLPYVKKIYYLDVDFYHYFIGREDQSVNEKVMIQRIDQQLKVNYIMADEYKNDQPLFTGHRRLRKYMFDYLEIITAVSSIMCILSNDSENIKKKNALWNYIKQNDPYSYKRLCRRLFSLLRFDNPVFSNLCKLIYRVGRFFFGYN